MPKIDLLHGLDPFNLEDIPEDSYLNRVASRAVALMKGRSRDQIYAAADTAYMLSDSQVAEIEGRYEQEAINRRLEELQGILDDSKTWRWKRGSPTVDQEKQFRDAVQFCTLREDSSGVSQHVLNVDDPNISAGIEIGPIYVNWLDALKEAAEDTILDGDYDENFPDAKEYEYFAAYALMKVGESYSLSQLKWLGTNFSATTYDDGSGMRTVDHQFPYVVKRGSAEHLHRLARSHDAALEALESICHAEHLYALALGDRDVDTEVRNRMSIQSKLGGDARSARYLPVRERAYQLAKSRAPASGTWPSRRRAVMAIQTDVLAYAKEIDLSLSQTQAEITIDGWLRAMPESSSLFGGKRRTPSSKT